MLSRLQYIAPPSINELLTTFIVVYGVNVCICGKQ